MKPSREVPADTRLTTSAGLYLKPITGIPDRDARGPDAYIEKGRPSGFFGKLVGEWGPVWGSLDVTESGLRWRPRRRSARWGFSSFEIAWGSMTGADLRFVYSEGREALLTIETISSRVEFMIPSIMEAPMREVLDEYLESSGPPAGGRFGVP